MCLGRSNRSERGRPPSPVAQHAEPQLTAGIVGTPSFTCSDAERRARMTTVLTLAAAQNGTSGVFAESKHAGREATWATPWTGDGGQ
jgi:hypothetical protein